MKRRSFKLYTDYFDCIEHLTDEQLGVLFKAIFFHELGKEYPNMDEEVSIAMAFISNDLFYGEMEGGQKEGWAR